MAKLRTSPCACAIVVIEATSAIMVRRIVHPLGNPPQSAVRHLVMVDLFVRRPIPTTLFQITPQFASGSEGHTAVDAFVRSDHGEDLGVVIEDHEASPTGGSAIACAHPFHFHDTSTKRIAVASI